MICDKSISDFWDRRHQSDPLIPMGVAGANRWLSVCRQGGLFLVIVFKVPTRARRTLGGVSFQAGVG